MTRSGLANSEMGGASEMVGRRRRTLRAATLLLVLPVVPAALTAWLHPRRPDWTALAVQVQEGAVVDLDMDQIGREFPNVLWIDARARTDFDEAHVPGAVHLDESTWDAGFSTLTELWDGQRAIVVYCGGGGCLTSQAVARRLRGELDFNQVYVLRGGWPAWSTVQMETSGAGGGASGGAR